MKNIMELAGMLQKLCSSGKQLTEENINYLRKLEMGRNIIFEKNNLRIDFKDIWEMLKYSNLILFLFDSDVVQYYSGNEEQLIASLKPHVNSESELLDYLRMLYVNYTIGIEMTYDYNVFKYPSLFEMPETLADREKCPITFNDMVHMAILYLRFFVENKNESYLNGKYNKYIDYAETEPFFANWIEPIFFHQLAKSKYGNKRLTPQDIEKDNVLSDRMSKCVTYLEKLSRKYKPEKDCGSRKPDYFSYLNFRSPDNFDKDKDDTLSSVSPYVTSISTNEENRAIANALGHENDIKRDLDYQKAIITELGVPTDIFAGKLMKSEDAGDGVQFMLCDSIMISHLSGLVLTEKALATLGVEGDCEQIRDSLLHSSNILYACEFLPFLEDEKLTALCMVDNLVDGHLIVLGSKEENRKVQKLLEEKMVYGIQPEYRIIYDGDKKNKVIERAEFYGLFGCYWGSAKKDLVRSAIFEYNARLNQLGNACVFSMHRLLFGKEYPWRQSILHNIRKFCHLSKYGCNAEAIKEYTKLEQRLAYQAENLMSPITIPGPDASLDFAAKLQPILYIRTYQDAEKTDSFIQYILTQAGLFHLCPGCEFPIMFVPTTEDDLRNIVLAIHEFISSITRHIHKQNHINLYKIEAEYAPDYCIYDPKLQHLFDNANYCEIRICTKEVPGKNYDLDLDFDIHKLSEYMGDDMAEKLYEHSIDIRKFERLIDNKLTNEPSDLCDEV